MRIPPQILLVFATMLWAGNFVVGRAVAPEMPPIAMNFWRWFAALLILLPFALEGLWHHRRTVLRCWRGLSLLAFTGCAGFHSFVYSAVAETTAVNAALFLALSPLLIPLFAYPILGAVPNGRQIAGTAASLIGAVVLIGHGDLAVLTGLAFNRGDLLMALGVPLWSLYTVLLRKTAVPLPPVTLLAAITLFTLVMLAPAYVMEMRIAGTFEWSREVELGILYFALGPSIFAYLAWNRGVAAIGASKAGLFNHCIPVFAALLGIALLGEKLHGYHFAGAGLVACGILLASLPAGFGRNVRTTGRS